MKKRIIVTMLVLSMFMSACSSSASSQIREPDEKTVVSEDDKEVEKKEEGGAAVTQEIVYHALTLQIPNNWKYVENDDDRVMIYRTSEGTFFCGLDCYNISEDVDENSTEEDIYPICRQLIENDENASIEAENGHFLGCPAVLFSGNVDMGDGTIRNVNGVVFVAEITMYEFFYMSEEGYDNSKEIEVAEQIRDSITIAPEINTNLYSVSSSQEAEKDDSSHVDGESADYDESGIQTFTVADSFKNMTVGDIGKMGDVYVGLSYVKRASTLPTALGDSDEIGEGNEVILGFFDFYNDSENRNSVKPEDITCYADGVQVAEVQDNYINIVCDGIRQLYSVEMDDYTKMITVQDYEVPSGWNELKFFYESECVWTVSADDVSEDDFEFETMYPVETTRIETEEDTVIYSGDYDVTFKGTSDYTYENSVWGDQDYVIFKFNVTNNSDAPIDYSLAGYEMAAYQDNYSLGESSYAIDEQIDGYSNIYNIDKIEPGMSANIYIAFDTFVSDGDLYMVYDDGYIYNSIKGTVFVDR